MYNYIINPNNLKKIKINSNDGIRIMRNYIKKMKGSSTKDERKINFNFSALKDNLFNFSALADESDIVSNDEQLIFDLVNDYNSKLSESEIENLKLKLENPSIYPDLTLKADKYSNIKSSIKTSTSNIYFYKNQGKDYLLKECIVIKKKKTNVYNSVFREIFNSNYLKTKILNEDKREINNRICILNSVFTIKTNKNLKVILVFPLLKGFEMSNKKFRKLSPSNCKKFYINLLETLELLEKYNFYHNDIKPDNIFYNIETKMPVLIDLGESEICNLIDGSNKLKCEVSNKLNDVNYLHSERYSSKYYNTALNPFYDHCNEEIILRFRQILSFIYTYLHTQFSLNIELDTSFDKCNEIILKNPLFLFENLYKESIKLASKCNSISELSIEQNDDIHLDLIKITSMRYVKNIVINDKNLNNFKFNIKLTLKKDIKDSKESCDIDIKFPEKQSCVIL